MARSRIIAGKAVIIIEAQSLIDKTLGKIRSNLHRFANAVGNLGETTFRTGFFGAIASGVIINQFVKFDDAMRILRVNLDLFGKSAAQVNAVMKPLEETIRALAKTTPFSPTQVAQAATELAKGGFNPQEIKDSLQGVLDLARATNSELGTTATLVINALKAYNIPTNQADEIVSQLVRATRKGVLGIDDLAAALKYSSGTADILGVSLQKMLAIFTILSNKSLIGSIAGTSTNTAFAQLIKKSEELASLGAIPLFKGVRSDGREAIDVIKTLNALFTYSAKLPLAEQVSLFQDVFNLRGARSVAALRDQIANIDKLADSIANAKDEARQAATIVDEGIGGSLRRLVSTIQDLNIGLGSATEGVIIKIAQTIKGLLEELNKLSALNPALTASIILSPAILLAAGVGLLALSKALRIAAISAGLLKSTLSSLGGFLARGTVDQISLLASLGRSKAAKPDFKAIKTPKTPVASTLTYSGPAAGISAANKNALQLAQNQRFTALAVQRTAKAEVLLKSAETARRSSSAKLADSVRQVTVAQQRNTDAIARQSARVKAAAGVYAQELRLKTQLAEVERKLAFARTQTKLFPGSARIFQTPLEEQRKTLRKQIKDLSIQVGRGFKPITPVQALTQSINKRAVLTAKQNKLDKVATALTRGKAVVENRYVQQLAKSQDLLLSANKATQAIRKIPLTKSSLNLGALARSAGGTAINTIKSLGTVASSSARGLLTFSKSMLTFLNGIRRFVFTGSGILTIVEGLILFGDRIPGVSSVLERLGKAFSNAFKAIANIAKFAKGPIDLFKVAIEAFSKDRSDLGIKAIQLGFKSLIEIIGSQLVAAWNRFKEALGPVWDTLRGIVNTLSATLDFLIKIAGIAIGEVFGDIAGRFSSLSNLFGSGGGLVSGLQGVIQGFLSAIGLIASRLTEFAIRFSALYHDFLEKLELTFLRAAAALGLGKLVNLQSRFENLRERRSDRIARQKDGIIAARTANKEFQTSLKNIFGAAPSEIRSRRTANAAAGRSSATSQAATGIANEIRRIINRVIPQTPQQFANFDQGITPATVTRNRSVQQMVQLADALVGSAQSTRRNLLRPGKTVEEKQLSEAEKQTDLLRKIADDKGLLFGQ